MIIKTVNNITLSDYNFRTHLMKSFSSKLTTLSLLLCLLAFPANTVLGQDEKQEAKPEATPTQEGAKATDENEENTAGPLSGHSYHGEAFNEGPRQRAYLIPGMSNVDFPITTQNKEAQKFFNQGVSALHGFWYLEAERAFRQVNKFDPDCAMAYWGMAMSNFNNSKRAKVFMEEAESVRKVSPMSNAGSSKPCQPTNKLTLVRRKNEPRSTPKL